MYHYYILINLYFLAFIFAAYSCALCREILLHGRMFVSQNWICFHSNIFTYETQVSRDLSLEFWGREGGREGEMCQTKLVHLSETCYAKKTKYVLPWVTDPSQKLKLKTYSQKNNKFWSDWVSFEINGYKIHLHFFTLRCFFNKVIEKNISPTNPSFQKFHLKATQSFSLTGFWTVFTIW